MNGIVKNNPANDPDKKPYKSRSRFKPNVSVYQTARFGEASPFYGAEVVPDDENFSLRVNSDVDTLTLKSPLMSPLRMNKDYFFAPLRAILPKTSDLLVTNPITGDDVLADQVNCVVLNSRVPWIAGHAYDSQNPWEDFRGLATTPTFAAAPDFMKFVFLLFFCFRLGWCVFSSGSLARNLGFNWHNFWIGSQPSSRKRRVSFDMYFDSLFSWLSQRVESLEFVVIDGVSGEAAVASQPFKVRSLTVYPTLDEVISDNNTAVNLRQFIYLLQQGMIPYRLNSLTYVDGYSLANIGSVLPAGMQSRGFTLDTFHAWRIGPFMSRLADSAVVTDHQPGAALQVGQRFYNLQRLVAYQLACAQFYTTDSIDYIYNCQLWHDNMLSLRSIAFGSTGGTFPTFTYNGIRVQYDSVSGLVMDEMASSVLQYQGLTSATPWIDEWTDGSVGLFDLTDFYLRIFVGSMLYFTNLLGFVRSLKFRDYFVGSKVRPLAVGDVNVKEVVPGEFSVVDITKNIMRQRFLNQVNRVGRSLREYSRGIFGASPVFDPHEVVFLGSTTDIIGAEETQNTGSEQRNPFAITSHLRSQSSKFAFEGSFQENGVVVGIVTFDVARPYANHADAPLSHVDRYDMFNPFMQTIGDQAVLGSEIDGNQNNENVGYQMRYMEYRQRVDYAAGGFLDYLPGFAFVADFRNISSLGRFTINVSPDFIRSRSYEFDDLYEALPNFSPAGYFHFIIRHDCEVSIDRPMLAAPTIL